MAKVQIKSEKLKVLVVQRFLELFLSVRQQFQDGFVTLQMRNKFKL